MTLRRRLIYMIVPRYLINGKMLAAHDGALQAALAQVYGTPARPRCLCVDGGVEMYVSKFDEFVVKRMPDSGARHAPACPSFEPASNESGLGQLLGEAIIEHRPDLIELRLDFPLARRVRRTSAVAPLQRAAQVNATHKQLSLRGLLHYLWERAGLNRWYPAMQGKRSYAVVRKYVLQACEEIQAKGLRLSERVFMPEPFAAERAAEIASRHRTALAPLAHEAPSRCNLMVAIGELKTLAPAALGHRVVLKHLPDCLLFIEMSASERVMRVFDNELVAWASGRVKLVVACLIHARDERCYVIDEFTLMMTNPEWIPLDHLPQGDVAAKLVSEERAFIRPLHYDAPEGSLYPDFLLLDVGARPLALDIVSAFANEDVRCAKIKAIACRNPHGWVWDTANDLTIPALPSSAATSRTISRPLLGAVVARDA